MELSPNQCIVLATAIPVLMVAVGVERASVPFENVGRWMIYAFGSIYTANAWAFVLMVVGVDDGLSAYFAVPATLVILMDFAALIGSMSFRVAEVRYHQDGPRRNHYRRKSQRKRG